MQASSKQLLNTSPIEMICNKFDGALALHCTCLHAGNHLVKSKEYNFTVLPAWPVSFDVKLIFSYRLFSVEFN